MKKKVIAALFSVVVVSAGMTVAGEAAAGPVLPERITARLVDTQGAVSGRTATQFTLQVDSLSSDEEVLELATVLKHGGQEALRKALWNIESKGFVRIGAALGYQVAVIRYVETDQGRIIRVVTDRPIQFAEVWQSSRSRGYPFGYLEIFLGPDGTGEGQMIAAAEARFTAEGRVELVSLGTRPFKIMKAKAEPVKAKKK